MPAGIATTRDSRWLHSRLNTIGPQVFPDQVRQGYTGKAIVYRQQGTADLVFVNRRALTRTVWLVFVTQANATKLQLESDADAIDDALEGQGGFTVSGRIIEACRREAEYAPPALVEEGVSYQSLGGFYVLLSSKA